jgi:glyoxalase superfamily protein
MGTIPDWRVCSSVIPCATARAANWNHSTSRRSIRDCSFAHKSAEVARLEGLGAGRADVGQGPDVSWVVLADSDGNEFCVLRALKPEDQTYEGPQA